MSRRYPPEVHAFIRENVAGRTTEELAAITNAAFGTTFTKHSMKSYKANHKLKSGTPLGNPKGHITKKFPQPIVDYIYAHCRGVGPTEMAKQLNSQFGTEYTKVQIKAFYGNHGLSSGLTGRFEKGNVPPNKGKTGYYAPGCEKTWFKKGHQPWDTVPVGTVIAKSDGYLWKKIDDKPGVWTQNWRQLHLLVWEEVNGAVPEGYRVIFKDGNKANCSIENLALVSLAENLVLNRYGLRTVHAAHTETGILIAKVKIAAEKRIRKRS